MSNATESGGSPAPSAARKSGVGTKTAAALTVVIIFLAAFLAYYDWTTQSQLSSRDATISSQSSTIAQQVSSMAVQSSQIQVQSAQIQNQSSKITSLSAAIASDEQQIGTLEANLTSTMNSLSSAKAQIATDGAQITADNDKIASLTAGYSKANGTIASQTTEIAQLNANVTTLQSQVSSLNAEATSLQKQVTTLNDKISSLQTQVLEMTDVENLADETIESSSQLYQIPAGSSSGPGVTDVTTFSAPYAGYIVVNMSSISDIDNVGIGINMTFSSHVHSSLYLGDLFNWGFSSVPDSPVIPVTPGTVSIVCLNYDTTAQSETLSVAYYY